MIAVWIVLGLAALLVLLVLASVVRAALLKPTAAKTASYDVEETPRAHALGERLARLIRIETVSVDGVTDAPKFHTFHKALEEMYPNLHRVCERTVLTGSLLFRWRGADSARPAVLLLSHHDVVEATGAWTHAPFGGEMENGRIYGRGALDTKGSLLCILEAAEQLIGDGYTPACDVYIASSCTEETSGCGGRLTAKYLKERGVRFRVSIDEGGMFVRAPMAGVEGLYAMVGVLEKGYGDLKFTARSTGGHSSTPAYHTPIARLAAFVHAVEAHDPFTPRINDTTAEMFRRMAPNAAFYLRVLWSNLWLYRPLLTYLMRRISPTARAMTATTAVFTTMRGSTGYNVIPEEAYVTANLRYAHHQPNVAAVDIIRSKAAQYGLETEIIHDENPCKIVDYRTDVYQQTAEAIRGVCPGACVIPYPMTGATDSRYYNELCDNSLRFVPLYADEGQLAGMHGLDENIHIRSLETGVTFFIDWIRRQTQA